MVMDFSSFGLPTTAEEAANQGNPPVSTVPQPVIPSAPINNETLSSLLSVLQNLQNQQNQVVVPTAEPVQSIPQPEQPNPLQRLERLEAAVTKIVSVINRTLGPGHFQG